MRSREASCSSRPARAGSFDARRTRHDIAILPLWELREPAKAPEAGAGHASVLGNLAMRGSTKGAYGSRVTVRACIWRALICMEARHSADSQREKKAQRVAQSVQTGPALGRACMQSVTGDGVRVALLPCIFVRCPRRFRSRALAERLSTGSEAPPSCAPYISTTVCPQPSTSVFLLAVVVSLHSARCSSRLKSHVRATGQLQVHHAAA